MENSDAEIFDNEDEDFEEEYSLQSFNILQHCILKPKSKKNNFSKFMLQFHKILLEKLKHIQQTHINFKVRAVLLVEYYKPSKLNENHEPAYLSSRNYTVYNEFEIESAVKKICLQIDNRNTNYMRFGSGLSIKEIKSATIDIAKIRPLRGGGGNAKLPYNLEKKHAIINVQNTDERCFGYAILSALHEPNYSPHRPSHYNHLFTKYGLNYIRYPVEPHRIPTIEDQLQISINIDSFNGDDGTDIYILLLCL